MRRPSRFRKHADKSWSSFDTETMNNIPQSPTSQRSLRGRDTGFPESFCGHRNTSLPHPDANLAPDASLTEADITPNLAIARHRMSVLVSRGPRARALTDSALPMGTPNGGTSGTSNKSQQQQQRQQQQQLNGVSAGGGGSDRSRSSSELSEDGGHSPTKDVHGDGYESRQNGEHGRRRSLIRRLIHHK
ncbi:hypothetical protein B0T25DRAFT_87744 [Lasiosphaeria hispida]|uniref:Uncharacterized protein n=1 Tax=Lasiosphaeria hispida TaxID=260671 RepID=A0AAJ0HPN1_9PEZI|nr:hypothetical protein B0T25DRAFT_87744 [Lasiosphaeria hispida]